METKTTNGNRTYHVPAADDVVEFKGLRLHFDEEKGEVLILKADALGNWNRVQMSVESGNGGGVRVWVQEDRS